MASILCDSNIPFLKDCFNPADIRAFSGKELTRDLILGENAEVVFLRSTVKVNEELLSGTRVGFVATATSGTDHMDIDYLKSAGIYIASALGSNANSVAEYVIYAVLKYCSDKNIDARNKTVGIIGCGCVGRLVAKYSYMLGLKVIVNDPPLKDSGFTFPGEYEYAELNDLISRSDILTNHVPLTKTGQYATQGLIGKEQLELLQPGALIIHASRGGVIPEKILADFADRKNFSLAIDVWEQEPSFNSELVARSFLASPHVAGHTLDGKLRGSLMNALSYEEFSGKSLDTSQIDRLLSEYQPSSASDFNDHDELLSRLTASRKLADETEFMRLHADNDDKGKAFSDRRANYPVRREIL